MATAAQLVVVAQLTAVNESLFPAGVWLVHVVPPFVVASIPLSPTAKHTLMVGQLIALQPPVAVDWLDH
jgi:hypothetical protein